MKNLFCNSIIFSLFFFLSALQAAARQGTAVKAAPDRTSILIGEPVTIRLEADIPENEPIRFFYTDTIPHFEFLAKEKIDTVNTGTGTRLTQLIRITSFDSGHWVVPPFILREGVQTDSFHINVSFTPFNPEQPYHDIKDIMEAAEEKKKEQPWWWYLAGGAVLLALLLYLLFRKKKTIPAAKPAVIRDPYKEAMEKLGLLTRQRPEIKQYYAVLADTFREYTHASRQIYSLQQTTNELVAQLRELQMPEENFKTLAAALRLSDWVKFAKYQPGEAENKETLQHIREAIEWLESTKPNAV